MARSWRNFKQGEYGLFYHWRVLACSDEFRARHFGAIGDHQPVGRGVIDHEGIGARKGGDVAVRPMHDIAIKNDHRARIADGCDDAMLGRRR